MMPVKQITEQQQVEAPAHELVLPVKFVGKFTKLDTTPSVRNVEKWQFINTAPVTVTNFDDGQDGQELKILGDGQTTIQNNANILTNTAADKLLQLDYVYMFIRFNSKWYEI